MCPRNARQRRAFTLLELEVTLVILAVGLLGVASLMAMQSRQMRRVEAWCRTSPTYTVLSHTNRWLRQLNAPAELTGNPAQSAWAPPVTHKAKYTLAPGSVERHLGDQQMSVVVTLEPVSPPPGGGGGP
jgi:prepilin-type N-terminal cleavage/methylation domain-containing protein